MKQIYLIAENVAVVEDGEERVQTVVAYNFGAFETEEKASEAATAYNQEDYEGDDVYYALAVEVKA